MRATLSTSAHQALRRNLDEVRDRLAEAARVSGRSPDDVTLVVVTKAAHPAVLEALPALGCRDVGENRIAQLRQRHAVLGSEFRWHMIGHLQRNKVGPAIETAHLIHSVDSTRLLDALDRRAGNAGVVSEVLLEVNVSGETSKHGFSPSEAGDALRHAAALSNVRTTGLMTMAPYTDDEGTIRSVFAGLRTLRDGLNAGGFGREPLSHLSMGMSNDYRIAVEEGATLVRVGSAILRGVETPVAGEGRR